MKKVLDFFFLIIYINIVNRIAFFYAIIMFIGAVYSENCGSAVLLTQKMPPLFIGESQMAIKIRCCKCGCGSKIIITKWHKYKVIPDYISGHNLRNNKLSERWENLKDIIKYCKCGCGQKIVIKPRHKYQGIPNYIIGHHNYTLAYDIRKKRLLFVEKYCECGCKTLLTNANKGQRYISGHNLKEWYGNRKNSKASKETRKKMSISQTGKKHNISPEGKQRMRETGYKVSQSNIGRPSKLKDKPRSKETKRKVSIGIKKAYEEGRFKPRIDNSKWFNTKIELAIEEQLKLKNISYIKQYFIKDVGYVDFFLPEYSTILECDGDYWHNLPGMQKKDFGRDFAAMFCYNYKTIRFWEHEINESPEKCMKKLSEIVTEKE